MRIETNYGVRLFWDGSEDTYEDITDDMTLEEALDCVKFHREHAAKLPGWRVTRAVLITQRVDIHPWLEQVEEEEEARGR